MSSSELACSPVAEALPVNSVATPTLSLAAPLARWNSGRRNSPLTPGGVFSFRRGNEPSFGSTPRRMGGGRRVVEDASEEEADAQSDYNGTKSME